MCIRQLECFAALPLVHEWLQKHCKYWSWSYKYILANKQIHKYQFWIMRINGTSLGISLHTSLGWTRNEVQHLHSLRGLERKYLIAIQPEKGGEDLVWGTLSRKVGVRLDLLPWLASKTFSASIFWHSWSWIPGPGVLLLIWTTLSPFLTTLSLVFSICKWVNLRTYLKTLFQKTIK